LGQDDHKYTRNGKDFNKHEWKSCKKRTCLSYTREI
jgi:hypothetical protein